MIGEKLSEFRHEQVIHFVCTHVYDMYLCTISNQKFAVQSINGIRRIHNVYIPYQQYIDLPMTRES